MAGSISLTLFIVGFILMITEPSFVKNGGSFMLIMLVAMYFSGPVAFFGIINFLLEMNPIKKAGETVSRAVDRNRNDENLLYKLNHQE